MGSRSPFRYLLFLFSSSALITHGNVPPGLVTTMFAVTGTLFSVVKRGQNDGKVS